MGRLWQLVAWPEQQRSSLLSEHVHQTRSRRRAPPWAKVVLIPSLHKTLNIKQTLTVQKPEMLQSLPLFSFSLLRNSQSALLQLIISKLFWVISRTLFMLDSPPDIEKIWVFYFSKLLTMMGRGRDMVRAPLMAQNVPTNLPRPLTG